MNRFSIRSLAYACHAVFWCVAILTIAAERAPAVKNFLAGLSGHHWISKSIVALTLFFAVAFVFAGRDDPQDARGLVKGVVASALAAALLIVVFYVAHYYGIA
jgi:hypothetical protein